MAKSNSTIKCRRVQTSATILPDGTLIRWFDIERTDTAQTVGSEVEVEEGFTASIHFSSLDWDYPTRESNQKRCCLSINTRYSKDGFLPLLKGSRVEVSLPHIKNGSQNEQNMGLRTGHIDVRSLKLGSGSVYFHISDKVSFALTPYSTRQDPYPTFAEIQASGQYLDHIPVKIIQKRECRKTADAA